jgi:hypothetical protein
MNWFLQNTERHAVTAPMPQHDDGEGGNIRVIPLWLVKSRKIKYAIIHWLSSEHVNAQPQSSEVEFPRRRNLFVISLHLMEGGGIF